MIYWSAVTTQVLAFSFMLALRCEFFAYLLPVNKGQDESGNLCDEDNEDNGQKLELKERRG